MRGFVYILVCLIVAMNQTFVFTKYQLKYRSCIYLQAWFNLSLSIEENVLSGVFQSIHEQTLPHCHKMQDCDIEFFILSSPFSSALFFPLFPPRREDLAPASSVRVSP